jgi:hypothetical protein
MDAQFWKDVLGGFIGSGLGTALVGALFKMKFDAQLETQKAFLQRASKVHELQVEALRKLHRHLAEANGHLQIQSRAGNPQSEDPEERGKQFAKAFNAAQDEFAMSRLLFPLEIVRKCDDFFGKLYEGHVELGFAKDPMTQSGEPRAKLWDRARTIAHRELPALLAEIEKSAREVIHPPTVQEKRSWWTRLTS